MPLEVQHRHPTARAQRFTSYSRMAGNKCAIGKSQGLGGHVAGLLHPLPGLRRTSLSAACHVEAIREGLIFTFLCVSSDFSFTCGERFHVHGHRSPCTRPPRALPGPSVVPHTAPSFPPWHSKLSLCYQPNRVLSLEGKRQEWTSNFMLMMTFYHLGSRASSSLEGST